MSDTLNSAAALDARNRRGVEALLAGWADEDEEAGE